MGFVSAVHQLDSVSAPVFRPRTVDFDGLSPTQLRVLVCIARGLSSKEIACEIGRSTATVEGHIRLLLARFNARSRCHLIARVIREGVIDPCVSD